MEKEYLKDGKEVVGNEAFCPSTIPYSGNSFYEFLDDFKIIYRGVNFQKPYLQENILMQTPFKISILYKLR